MKIGGLQREPLWHFARRLRTRHWLAPALLALALPRTATAGFCRSDPVGGDQRHEFAFFVGYSPESATLLGTAVDRRFVLAGFDYSYRCWPWKHLSLSFTAGAMPAAILLQPKQTYLISTSPTSYTAQTVPSHAVYGFAVTPVGMTIEFARNHSVFPFIQTDEGIIATTEPIPENLPDATGLNFLFDFGGGVKWRLSGKAYGVVMGYKFLHISNAATTRFNPGVDNNVFYLGLSFFR